MNRLVSSAFQLTRITPRIVSVTPTRAQSVSKKVVAVKEDKSYVESDAKKICEHVCINYLVEGEEPGPKILPDSEYPEWLFKLNLEDPLPLEDMTPEEHGWLYWRALQNRHNSQMRRIRELKIKKIHLQHNPRVHRPKVYHK